MHIFLYGPPGTGKSTTGKILARSLKLPFVDLDSLIESKAGLSIAKIMKQHGETRFRDIETSALKDIAGRSSGVTSQVIALGGGALLRPENRALAEMYGRVVLLMAESRTLMERLHTGSDNRPLLEGDLEERLSVLLGKRKEHYDSFRLQLHTDDKTPEQIAWQVQVMIGRFHLRAMGEYDVVVQPGALEQLGLMLKSRELYNPIIVTDENVAKFHAEKAMASLRRSGFDPKVLTLPAGESYKTLETVSRLWHGFLEAGLDRRSTVLALGGGVIGDLAGFAAATFMRGVNWVGVPTTLLSMVDASLGGKTGFDLPEGKNLIGSFHPPRLVLADPALLSTLPQAEFRAGMAEVIKHGIIADPELFGLCTRGLGWIRIHLEAVVKRAMAVKIRIIEEDPYEKGSRAVLNLGHTVGHAVELVSGFGVRHGEAVSIGLVAEAKLAERLTVAGQGLSEAVSRSLSGLGLPIHIPKDLPRPELIRAMQVDKKRSNSVIRFALPAEVGRVELVEISDMESVLEN